MGSVSRITRIFDLILDAGAALSGCLLVTVMVVTVVKVFFRYVLNEGLIGVDQISGTLLLWMTFLGAAWVLRREEHVTIDLVTTQLPPRVRRWFGIATSAICVVICLIITVYGTMEAVISWQRGILIPAEIEMPRVVNLAVIPLGFFFLWLQFMRRTYLYFYGIGPGLKETAEAR